MYKLKKEYKGVVLTRSGRTIILDNIRSGEVEIMQLEKYFEKTKSKNKSKKDSEESDFISI